MVSKRVAQGILAATVAASAVLAAAPDVFAQASSTERQDLRRRMLQYRARATTGGETAPRETNQGAPLTDEEIARHVLNRMAFGPRPGQVEEVVRMGWKEWAKQQLKPRSIKDDEVESMARSRWPSLRMTMAEAFEKYRPPYSSEPPTPEELDRNNRLNWQIRYELRESVLLRAVHSERQFEQVIVEFWRNHFNIDQNKDDTTFLANHYEENVLRRHAFGKFEHLLLATAQHPAMLIYLDNIVSQKPLTEREDQLLARFEGRRYVPRSVAALGRQRGLNENYARELMELHTLGVDNGYTQRDVTEVARVLTGWTAGWTANNERDRRKQRDMMGMMAGGAAGDYGFVFRQDVHDDRPKTILGSRLDGDGGLNDGLRVIHALANHPRTAEFISWKLCRYLVRDDPSDDLVRRVSRVFKSSDGDLEKVYEAIIFSDDFLYRQNVGCKFKTPFEYVVSSLRATDAQITDAGRVLDSLRLMGQPIYECVDPTGYYDQAEAWLDPGVLIYRWTYALSLANGQLTGVTLGDATIRPLQILGPVELADKVLKTYIPNSASAEHDRVLSEAIVNSGSIEQALGLVLGSPAFQQQ